MLGKIHSFETFSTVDGPGVRVVVFLQGCFLNCIYCHNPDTWSLKAKKELYAFEVVNFVLEYKDYIKNGGVTLSGGEPLLQREFCLELLKSLKKEQIHTVIESACSLPLEFSKEVIDSADLLIIDLKGLEEDVLKICKINIQNTIDVLNYCEKINKKIWVRHVLLPNYTLKEEKLKKVADFLKQFKVVERVELLPFHKMGEFKWKELNMPYSLSEVKEPKKQDIEKAKLIFKEAKIEVVV